jgi:hypothetical protein
VCASESARESERERVREREGERERERERETERDRERERIMLDFVEEPLDYRLSVVSASRIHASLSTKTESLLRLFSVSSFIPLH